MSASIAPATSPALPRSAERAGNRDFHPIDVIRTKSGSTPQYEGNPDFVWATGASTWLDVLGGHALRSGHDHAQHHDGLLEDRRVVFARQIHRRGAHREH